MLRSGHLTGLHFRYLFLIGFPVTDAFSYQIWESRSLLNAFPTTSILTYSQQPDLGPGQYEDLSLLPSLLARLTPKETKLKSKRKPT